MNEAIEQQRQLINILTNLMPSYPLDFWQENTELFGALPEFDSMAIVTLITQLDDEYDLEFEDDDISAENFADIASLLALIASKR